MTRGASRVGWGAWVLWALIASACEPDAPRAPPAPERSDPPEAPETSKQRRVAGSRNPWTLSRGSGSSTPAAAPGEPPPEGLVRLDAEARWVVDGAGVRAVVHGPARVAFVTDPEPAVLVGEGIYSLERSASAPRGSAAVVASPSGVVRADGPARLVGFVAEGGQAVIEVVSGSVRSMPERVRIAAGQRHGWAGETGAPEASRQGRVEDRLRAWRAQPPHVEKSSQVSEARVREGLERALRAFLSLRDPPRGIEEPVLEHRRRLAQVAAGRMGAREALRASLLRYAAATLGERPPEGVELVVRARRALAGEGR